MTKKIFVMTKGEAELYQWYLEQELARLGSGFNKAAIENAATLTAMFIRSGWQTVEGITLRARETPGWGGYLVDVIREGADPEGRQWVEVCRAGRYGNTSCYVEACKEAFNAGQVGAAASPGARRAAEVLVPTPGVKAETPELPVNQK